MIKRLTKWALVAMQMPSQPIPSHLVSVKTRAAWIRKASAGHRKLTKVHLCDSAYCSAVIAYVLKIMLGATIQTYWIASSPTCSSMPTASYSGLRKDKGIIVTSDTPKFRRYCRFRYILPTSKQFCP